MPIGSLNEIVVHGSNPEALARFWQALIGGEVEVESSDCALLDGDEEGFFLRCQRSSGRSTAGGMHLDIAVDDLDAAIDEAEQLGARKVGGVTDNGDGPFQVLLDPAGNEFCLVES